VLAKHTEPLSFVDTLEVGVDRMRRNLKPMRKQVESLKGTRLPGEAAELKAIQGYLLHRSQEEWGSVPSKLRSER
jgi:hypothetical protein